MYIFISIMIRHNSVQVCWSMPATGEDVSFDGFGGVQTGTNRLVRYKFTRSGGTKS